MSFMWKQHQATGNPMRFQSSIESFTLHCMRSEVVVVFAVYQKHWLLDFVSCHEGRHLHVGISRLPEGSLLSLESEWRKRSVEGTAASDATCEQI